MMGGKVENVKIPWGGKFGYLDVVTFAVTEQVDLAVPGPEQPLVDGVESLFRKGELNVIVKGQTWGKVADEKAEFQSLDPLLLPHYWKDQNRSLKHSWLDILSLLLNSVHSFPTNSPKLPNTSTRSLSHLENA